MINDQDLFCRNDRRLIAVRYHSHTINVTLNSHKTATGQQQ